jgi:lipopolysaccharide assembly protein A
MQFLKTLFWVALAVVLVLFGSANWHDVTLNLWGGLEADVKLPVLVLASFLLGFVPMLIVHRARLWTAKRRLEALERQTQAAVYATPAPTPVDIPTTPSSSPERRPDEDRIATDSKLWPAP